LNGDARGKTVALLGLTFKPNTDDMRDAPSLSIVQALQDAGAAVRGYDPEGVEQARPMMPCVEFFDDPYKAAEGADAVVLVTEWDVLRALDLRRLAATMEQPILVDLRNVYPPEDVRNAGLRWHGIGRAPEPVS
jgi:UDPglucose 6-dehydrogenase